jgi:hypothetical protein
MCVQKYAVMIMLISKITPSLVTLVRLLRQGNEVP